MESRFCQSDNEKNADGITGIKLQTTDLRAGKQENNKLKDAAKLCRATENQLKILSKFITKTDALHISLDSTLSYTISPSD